MAFSCTITGTFPNVQIQIPLQVSSGIILQLIPYVDFIDLTIIDKQLAKHFRPTVIESLLHTTACKSP
jgi:hypothetical protein